MLVCTVVCAAVCDRGYHGKRLRISRTFSFPKDFGYKISNIYSSGNSKGNETAHWNPQPWPGPYSGWESRKDYRKALLRSFPQIFPIVTNLQ